MTWVVTAVVGGSLIGGLLQGNAAKSAAQTQSDAQMQAAQIGLQEFNTITGQEQPFMQAGYGAQNQLNYLLGIGSPQGGGYQPQGQYGATPAPQSGGMTVGYGTSGIGGPSASGPGARLTGGLPTGYTDLGVSGGKTMPLSHLYRDPSGNVTSTLPAATGGTGTPTGMPTGTQAGAPATPGMGGSFGSLLQPFTTDMFHQMSPAYQFQLQQGQQGTLNAANTTGSALAPAAQKELMAYNQNYANTAFNNAFNQYQLQQGNIYNRLAGVAQLGQNAAANLGSQGTQLAGNIGQSVASAGAAQAAGQIGAANAYSGALSSLPWLAAVGQSAGLSPQSVSTPMLPITGP
jgi:hypothetical protein